jgi:ribonuclease P protein component
MLEPLNAPAQFSRVLATPALARHARWAIHARDAVGAAQLSTGESLGLAPHVDECSPRGLNSRLGCILPKRLARRAVTRALLRRLARPAALAAQHQLDTPHWWVLRLTAPIPKSDFPSATSEILRRQMRLEIEECFRRAVEGRRKRLAVATRQTTEAP